MVQKKLLTPLLHAPSCDTVTLPVADGHVLAKLRAVAPRFFKATPPLTARIPETRYRTPVRLPIPWFRPRPPDERPHLSWQTYHPQSPNNGDLWARLSSIGRPAALSRWCTNSWRKTPPTVAQSCA